MKWVENMQLPSTDPHMSRRPPYNGVQPGSPRGSFMTLLLLPQCHAAFSMILSTLVWVDQSPVCQCVCHSNPQQVSPPQLLPPPIWPRVRIHVTLRYGWGVGFMGGNLFTLLYCSIILVNAEFFVVSDKYCWHFLLPLHYMWAVNWVGFVNMIYKVTWSFSW